MPRWAGVIAGALAAFVLGSGVCGPTPSPSAQTPVYRAGTNLAQVRFQVVRSSRYVEGLTPADIRLLENGTERPVALFDGGCGPGITRTTPIEITVLFDISGSVMDASLLDWVAYRQAFIDALSTARTSVYAFNKTLWRVAVNTRDPAVLRDALSRVANADQATGPLGGAPIALTLPSEQKANPMANSWIYEALLATARTPAPSDGTRTIFLVTDGWRSTSTPVTYVRDELQALGVSVFPLIVVSGFPQTAVRSDKFGQMERADLRWLAQQTGGRSFDPFVVNADTLRTALAIVSETIQCEYVVGVTLSSAPKGRSHTLEVRLRSKKLGELRGGKRTIRD